MNKLAGVAATLVLIQSAATWAQGPGVNAPRQPVESGAIIMPPKNDPAATGKPSEGIDQKAEASPSEGARQSAKKPPGKVRKNAAKGKQSKEAACQGPAELCKQSSPR
jgi:hypothetical protein